MRRCARCGEPLDEHGETCPRCGSELTDQTASFEAVPAAPGELSGAVANAESPMLIVRKGPDVGETFYLDRPELTVGRDPGCDIFLNDVTVSRRHSKLLVSG